MELKNSEEVRTRSLIALEQAINIMGNSNRLGKALGISSAIITQWKRSGKYGVNAKYVLPIETLTNNQVKRYDLRCDVYPEADTYFFMIKKVVYNICKTHGLINLQGLGGVISADNLPITLAVITDIATFRDKYLLSANHIPEVLEYTNHPNQFKLHLLDGDEWQSDAKFASHAYYAMYADICVALYEYLQRDAVPDEGAQ